MNGPNSYSTLSSFAGGLSVAEWTNSGTAQGALPLANPNPATTRADLQYTRGPDMGGGVGGLLHSKRKETAAANATPTYTHKFNLANGRGDIIAQTDSTGALTWTASYDASGRRPKETGSNADRQRSNSKEEDETGLVNDHHRYRDPVTLSYLTLDPAGFVDGPNLYAYVNQNPWSKFDPEGLYQEAGHYYTTYMVAIAAGWSQENAYDLAYYSQAPDEHRSLTAFSNVPRTGAQIISRSPSLAAVQHSLHGLTGATGAAAVAERRSRIGALVARKGLSTEERGYAIHAFGDAYAHSFTDGTRINRDHSSTQDRFYGARGANLGHGPIGIQPDLISARPELYASYVDALAGTLAKAAGTTINSAKLSQLKALAFSLAEENRDQSASSRERGKIAKEEAVAFEKLAKTSFGMTTHMKNSGSNYNPSPDGSDQMILDPSRPIDGISAAHMIIRTTDPQINKPKVK